MYYGSHMELQALHLAFDMLRRGEFASDILLLHSVSQMIHGRLGEEYKVDESFVVEKCREFHPHEESITKEFNKVREGTPLQYEFYNREKDYRFKLDCASSIADLDEKNYYSAAEGFLNLVKDVDKYDYSKVLSSEDIITYGLVCAMATFDRAKLQGAVRKVMEPVGVVHHLKEIIKPFGVVFYLTEIIKHFLEERFSACIELYTMGFVDPRNENEVRRIILDSGGLVVPESQVIRLIESKKIQGRIEESSGRKFLHLTKQRL
ncbi:unnamed protein product [Arabis nemorensis]|uniref:26S proteasome regulatory subunit Rpn7 N-terminal domain-containing protein n=1 Tax=Arabis nemorensis TaxID=586526 RepID=A0A565B726_9BRAS|nr:unnamed protein product [Arabis nemorensis]